MHVLVINAGSSSVKYQILDPASGQEWLRGAVELRGTRRRGASWQLRRPSCCRARSRESAGVWTDRDRR